MGVRAAAVKTGFKNKLSLTEEITDDPYSHLAVSIIIQAFDDLRALNGQERITFIGQVINKHEVVNFFTSDWCDFLLSCQNAVSHEQLESAVFSKYKKGV